MGLSDLVCLKQLSAAAGNKIDVSTEIETNNKCLVKPNLWAKRAGDNALHAPLEGNCFPYTVIPKLFKITAPFIGLFFSVLICLNVASNAVDRNVAPIFVIKYH